jgi:hypothetical protein
MKSNKQRRAEIKARRLERATALEARLRAQDARKLSAERGPSAGSGAGRQVPACALQRHVRRHAGLLSRSGLHLPRLRRRRGVDGQAAEVVVRDRARLRLQPGRPLPRVPASPSRAARCRLGARGCQLCCARRWTRLHALASGKPTPDALAQVEAALQSKWRSLRVVAIEVMGCWGGPEQIARLEAFVAARHSGSNHRVWEREAARRRGEGAGSQEQRCPDEVEAVIHA